MELMDNILGDYLEQNCDVEAPLLEKIRRETYLKETQPHMLSGHYQGRLLALISKMLSPKRILEIGTFTGYATLCLAEGLTPNGHLDTIDINDELAERVARYFDESDYGDMIRHHLGSASEVLDSLEGPYDLVLIDADKKNNLHYLQMALKKTIPGSMILIDNVLWKGRILSDTPDKATQSMLDLNRWIAARSDLEKVILPVRDGLFMIRKIK